MPGNFEAGILDLPVIPRNFKRAHLTYRYLNEGHPACLTYTGIWKVRYSATPDVPVYLKSRDIQLTRRTRVLWAGILRIPDLLVPD